MERIFGIWTLLHNYLYVGVIFFELEPRCSDFIFSPKTFEIIVLQCCKISWMLVSREYNRGDNFEVKIKHSHKDIVLLLLFRFAYEVSFRRVRTRSAYVFCSYMRLKNNPFIWFFFFSRSLKIIHFRFCFDKEFSMMKGPCECILNMWKQRSYAKKKENEKVKVISLSHRIVWIIFLILCSRMFPNLKNLVFVM